MRETHRLRFVGLADDGRWTPEGAAVVVHAVAAVRDSAHKERRAAGEDACWERRQGRHSGQ